MSNHLDPDQIEQISELLADGRKIEAIKLYREATGRGLREAKELVEELLPRLKEQDPDRFANLSSGHGCTSVVVLCMASVGLALLRLLQQLSS